MDIVNIALLCGGVLILLVGLNWIAIERIWLTPPLIALGGGILIGPAALGWLDPFQWPHHHRLFEEILRLTLGVSVLAIAIHLPPFYVVRHKRALAVVLLAGMLLMWLVSTAVAYVALPVGFLSALLLGAIVTPTDPVLAGTVVTGRIAKRNIPGRLRHLLYAESAANDGLAYLFVLLPILLLTKPEPAVAWGEWFKTTLLLHVLLGAALGLVLGFATGCLQKFSQRFHLSDERGMLAMVIGLTLAVLGGVKLFGGDSIIAAFATGVGFHFAAHDTLESAQDRILDTVQRAAQLPAFMLFGLLIPWDKIGHLGWGGVGLVAGILLLRRLPAWLLLRPAIPEIHGNREAAFLGWFGPIGASAVFYAMLMHRRVGDETLWAAVALVVFASVVAHGLSATPLTYWLSRVIGERVASQAKEK